MALNALNNKPSAAESQSRETRTALVPAFCRADDRRPCVTICAPGATCRCGCEQVRRTLAEEVASRGLGVSLGTMKVGCDGECSHGPLVGFPRKGFFYTRVSPERARDVAAETLQEGHILFDLLHLDPTKATSGSLFYDRYSGFIATIDDRFCMVQVARYFLEFDEGVSCGKCVPCRVGSVELREILDGVIRGKGRPEDLRRLELVCYAMQEAPYCDFARTSSGPVAAILRYFRSEFEAHVEQGICPAGLCEGLKMEGK